MRLEDAAKLLGLANNIDEKSIKTAYRRACNKYHPDKGGSTKMMQAINQAYEVLKGFKGDLESGDLNYPDFLNKAINAIIHIQNINIEVCGAWVWVTGDTKPHAKELGKDGAGFFYASKKKAWYFRPIDWKSSSRGKFSLDDIRKRHGSNSVSGKSQKLLPV